MYRIDNATAAAVMPAAPPAVNPDRFFTEGNPATSTPATVVDAYWLNSLQEEMCYVIEQSGQTLDRTDRTQLYQAIQILLAGVPYGASSSSPNTYTATMSPSLGGYSAGQVVLVKFANANTGAATINLDGLGAQAMKRLDGSALSSGDILAGMIGILSYDGTNFQVLNAQVVKPSSIQHNEFKYAVDVGAANTLSATISPAPSGYGTGGLSVLLKVNATNTGAATVNLNGLGAKDIKYPNGSALTGRELRAGQIAELVYDGTDFQLINPSVEQGVLLGVQKITSSGTYTPTTGTKSIFVIAVGGGGGGAGRASSGTDGGNTSLGSLITAAGGTKGLLGASGGGGGNGGSGGTGGLLHIAGGDGVSVIGLSLGGMGGGNLLCTGGVGGSSGGLGGAAKANSGAGGGGGGPSTTLNGGGGGGAGETAFGYYTGITGTYAATIGAGGTGGAAGAGGGAGNVGAAGVLLIWEYS